MIIVEVVVIGESGDGVMQQVVGVVHLDSAGSVLNGLVMEDKLAEGAATMGEGHGVVDEKGSDGG